MLGLVLGLALALGLPGSTEGGPLPCDAGNAWCDMTRPPLERAIALVEAMNSSEVASQLISDFAKAAPAIAHLNVASYDYRSNVLHGLVDNGVATVFPEAIGMAATWSTALLHSVGQVTLVEQRAKHNLAVNASQASASPMDYGLNVWGPNINLAAHPLWGRNMETLGECPTLSGILGVAMVRGLQQPALPAAAGYLGLAATPKHFAAYQIDRMPPRLSFDPDIDSAELLQTYFPAFERVVRDGQAAAVMCAYNGYNGYPSCAHPALRSVLRDEWGFDGTIVSDSGAVEFMVTEQHYAADVMHAAALALNAGVDINSGGAYYQLPAALSAGLVTETALREAAVRAFEQRMRFGEFDPASSNPLWWYGQKDIASAAHQAINLQVARESIVLLKNDNSVLPLVESKAKNILVVGPNANSTMELVGNYYGCTFDSTKPGLLANCTFTTHLSGIRARAAKYGGSVTYVRGCDVESSDTSGFAAAVAAAKEADVVIAVMGLFTCAKRQGTPFANCESEGHDRNSTELPGVQRALLQALRNATASPLVLLLANGGPVALPWAAGAGGADAIVEVWQGGEQAGVASAEVLFGDVAPTGHMPFSVPRSDEQLPPNPLNISLLAGNGQTYRYVRAGDGYLYPFGYGLSYAQTEWAGLAVSPGKLAAAGGPMQTMTVNVTVTRGKGEGAGMAGVKDTLQVYVVRVTDETTPLLKAEPRISLVGFYKTDELAPGEAVPVSFEVDVRAMQRVVQGPGGADELQLVPGEYWVLVSRWAVQGEVLDELRSGSDNAKRGAGVHADPMVPFFLKEKVVVE